MKKITALFLLIMSLYNLQAQDEDSLFIQSLFNEALQSEIAYEQLIKLCTIAPGRLAGTEECDIALEYIYDEMKAMPFDTVYKQPCYVRKWTRGPEEIAWFDIGNGVEQYLAVDALGGSVATVEDGLFAEIIMLSSIEEMKSLGRDKIEGKIVFFNFQMNQSFLNTFKAYSENVGMRVYGADEASKFGAIGVLVRSLTLSNDTFPHTGIMRYKSGSEKIPGFGISAVHSDILAEAYKENPKLKVFLKCSCKEYPEVKQYNVIGEITGEKNPQRIISVGGHIDA